MERFRFHRLRGLLAIVVRHGFGLLRSLIGRRWPRLGRVLRADQITGPRRLRLALEELGGSFVKFGQMLSLQPDVLPQRYCNALYDLLDRIEPLPYSEVARIVAEDLESPPHDCFESFDERPLATASIGQVHRARYRGREVAVKVQRPGAQEEFAHDIRLMNGVVWLVRKLRLKSLEWLIAPVSEFATWTHEELDYRNEARYGERLRRLNRDNPMQYVPAVLRVTRRVLVVELLQGSTLVEYLRARDEGDELLQRRLAARGFDRRQFALNVIDNFLGDAFRHGLYHADLHPANLVILDDNTVGYVDFGITGILSPYSRRNLIAMTLALVRGDTGQLYHQFLKLSTFDETSDLAGFRSGLEKLAQVWYRGHGVSRRLEISFTRVMTDMLALSRRTNVMPERDIVKYIRSAIAIDGLNARFEPDFHVGEHLAEVCGRYLAWEGFRSRLTYDSVRSWAGAGGRLLTDGPARAAGFAERLTEGDFTLSARTPEPSRAAGDRRRALHVAALLAGLGVVAAFGSGPAELGWNPFSAQVAVGAMATLSLLPTLRRLGRRSLARANP